MWSLSGQKREFVASMCRNWRITLFKGQPEWPGALKARRSLLGSSLAVAGFVIERAPRKHRLSVTLIANNDETLDGVHAYLVGAGVESRPTRWLEDAVAVASSSSCVVLFPDAYAPNDVIACIGALRAAQPDLLLVVVTSNPQLLQSVLAPDGGSCLPVVLAKPAFGWSILDAIRVHSRVGER